MSRAHHCLALALAAGLLAGGCARDNGLPKELISHLAEFGIQIAPTRIHAPLSSRGGYVVTQYSPRTITNIIDKFRLEKIAPEDRRWQWAVQKAGAAAAAKELWGLAGRPVPFKLKSGAQFEYFYLLITADGWIYLIAEYAYG